MENVYIFVIEKLTLEAAERIPDVPPEIRETYVKAGRVTGAIVGMGLGAKIGAGFGIAGGPLGAIAGTLPGAVIFGLMGFFTGEKIGSNKEKISPTKSDGPT